MTDRPQRTVYERYAEAAERSVAGCALLAFAAAALLVLGLVVAVALATR